MHLCTYKLLRKNALELKRFKGVFREPCHLWFFDEWGLTVWTRRFFVHPRGEAGGAE